MAKIFEELKGEVGEYVPFCKNCRRFSVNPLNMGKDTLSEILTLRHKIHTFMSDGAPDPGGSAKLEVMSYSVDPIPFIDFHRDHELEIVTLEWIKDNL